MVFQGLIKIAIASAKANKHDARRTPASSAASRGPRWRRATSRSRPTGCAPYDSRCCNAKTVTPILTPWRSQPAHETRSQLLDARRAEQREFVLAHTGAGTPDRKFARSETLFRDWFRRTGVFDQSRPTSTVSDTGSSSCSKAATRSALLEQRQVTRHIASLAFEPQEIERLADRPKAHELQEWWKTRCGYVDDPFALHSESTRLELIRRRGRVVGGLPENNQDSPAYDTGKGRLDRARRKQQPVPPKVTLVQHRVPEAYLGLDRLASATAVRADDIYAQERLPVTLTMRVLLDGPINEF